VDIFISTSFIKLKQSEPFVNRKLNVREQREMIKILEY
jgi:hypothetical protein